MNYWQPGYRLVMTAILNTKVVLMLGFSAEDPDLRLFLQETREVLEHRGVPDYLFLERGKLGTIEMRDWRDTYGLEVIEYEASPGHPEVLQLITYLAGFAPPKLGTTAATRRRKARTP